MNHSAQLVTPNADHHYQITSKDTPLTCPMPGMSLWNSHPKVYLPIEETGHAKCPYCGAEYTMTDWSENGGHHH